MSGSNCCFLTCLQISQEAGQTVWYSHHLKNFPQFVVIPAVRGFSIVNEAEVDIFLEFSCFFDVQRMLAIWSLVPLTFLNPAWTSGSSWFTYCWSLAWRILSHQLAACLPSSRSDFYYPNLFKEYVVKILLWALHSKKHREPRCSTLEHCIGCSSCLHTQFGDLVFKVNNPQLKSATEASESWEQEALCLAVVLW